MKIRVAAVAAAPSLAGTGPVSESFFAAVPFFGSKCDPPAAAQRSGRPTAARTGDGGACSPLAAQTACRSTTEESVVSRFATRPKKLACGAGGSITTPQEIAGMARIKAPLYHEGITACKACLVLHQCLRRPPRSRQHARRRRPASPGMSSVVFLMVMSSVHCECSPVCGRHWHSRPRETCHSCLPRNFRN